MAETYDIVVVGLGPVGTYLGNLLGSMGMKVLLTEQTDGQEMRPRAAAMDDENLRSLENVGLAEEFLATTISAPDLQMLSAYIEPGSSPPRLLSGLAGPEGVGRPGAWPEWKREVAVGRDGFPRENRMFYQPEMEMILRRGLPRFPKVKVEFSQRCVGVDSVDGGCVVHLQKDSGSWKPTPGGEVRFFSEPAGPVRNVHCRFCLGTDGAMSVVREKCVGPKMSDLNYDERWWAVDIMLKDGDAHFGPKVPHYGHFVCEPKRQYIVLPGARVYDRPEQGRHVRVDIQVSAEDAAESGGDLESHAYVRRLISPWLADEDYEVVRFSLYRFWSLVAENWRTGNAFLVGDSCHTTPPFLGQGLNQGIKDCRNLAWKLKMVMDGVADESLLNSYQQEREDVVRNAVKGAVSIGKVADEFTKAQAQGPAALDAAYEQVRREKRGFEGFQITSTTLAHADMDSRSQAVLRGDGLTGRTVPNSLVRGPNGFSQKLDSVIGANRLALLCVSNDGTEPELDAAALSSLKTWDGHVVRLALKVQVLGTHFAELPASNALARLAPCAVLVRPDRIVYGVTKLDDAQKLLLDFGRFVRPSSVSRM